MPAGYTLAFAPLCSLNIFANFWNTYVLSNVERSMHSLAEVVII